MAQHNLFKTSSFRIVLKDQKSTEWLCQESNIPGISLGEMTINNSFNPDRRPGDTLTFNNLTLMVLCDENLAAFKEAHKYLVLSKNPESGDIEVQQNVFDGYLILTSNKNNVRHTIHLYDCWIQSVGDIQLQTTSSEDDVVTFQIEIVYGYYFFE